MTTRQKMRDTIPEYAAREDFYWDIGENKCPEHKARRLYAYRFNPSTAFVNGGESEYDLYSNAFPDTF